MNKLTTILAALSASISLAAQAAPGDLDSSFGVSGPGYTLTDIKLHDATDDLAVQRSKAIVSSQVYEDGAGDLWPVLTRVDAAGHPDASFGAGGVAGPAALIPGLLAYSQVASYKDHLWQVVRDAGRFHVLAYKPDGAPLPGFGVGGVATIALTAPISHVIFDAGIQTNAQRLVIATGARNPATGDRDLLLIGINLATGALDPAFGTGGLSWTSIHAGVGVNEAWRGISIDANDRILVGGITRKPGGEYDFAVGSFLANGAINPAFGVGGVNVVDFGYQDFGRRVLMQSGGRIVVSGSVCKVDPSTGDSYCMIGLAAFKPNGAVDAAYGSGGQVLHDLGRDGVVVTDHINSVGDRTVVSGQWIVDAASGKTAAFLQAFKPTGGVDGGFGSSGPGLSAWDYGVDSNAALAVQRQTTGRLAVGGAASDSSSGKDSAAVSLHEE